jgi:hypothetical protein
MVLKASWARTLAAFRRQRLALLACCLSMQRKPRTCRLKLRGSTAWALVASSTFLQVVP